MTENARGIKSLIDIHNHTLYGVDDGAESIEKSTEMLSAAREQGIDTVILTPHYRQGMFAYPVERITDHYYKLKEIAQQMGLSLYLGCEYHVDNDMIQHFRDGRCQTLAGTDYVLTEYSHNTDYTDIVRNTRQLISCGYIPVIAHVERYQCILNKPAYCEELQELGAWIQVNADSVLGLDGFWIKRFCHKLIRHEWIDVIASDTHGIEQRANHMKQCYDYITKKYGEAYAEQLMCINPGKITDKADEQ